MRPAISRALAGLALIALLAGGLAACGGGGDEDEGPTRAQYIARADRVCRDTTTQARPLLRRLVTAASGLTPPPARTLAPVGREVHELARGHLARLRAIEQPQDERTAIAAWLKQTQAVVAAIGRSAAALSAGRRAEAFGTLQATQTSASQANAAASDLGLSDCATVLSIS